MKRILGLMLILGVALLIGFAAGASAAGKSYQFTGVVKSSDGGVLTVEKSAKETWAFSTDKDTKGTAKVGDRVTVYYKMIATEIARFLGLPVPRRANITDVIESVCGICLDTRVSMIIVDYTTWT